MSVYACNKENMLLWVQGLRSGRFPQGRGHLKGLTQGPIDADGNRQPDTLDYCCLGVACEVAMENGVKMAIVAYGLNPIDYGFNGTSTSLPDLVAQWLGLGYETNPVIVDSDGLFVRAIRANDNLRWRFVHIADHLVRTYGLEMPQ